MAKRNHRNSVPPKFDPEEGTYYERVFSPDKVKVRRIDDKTVRVILSDRRGARLEVEGGRLVRVICRLLQPWSGYLKASQVYALRENPKELQKVLQSALNLSQRGFKAYFTNHNDYAEGKNAIGIASEVHKQISWTTIRKVVEASIKQAFGKVNQPDTDTDTHNKWTYRMPLKDSHIGAFVTVRAGNNIVKGKSGIRVYTRFRTEKGRGGRPACLNWCGMWEVPFQFFGLKTERLDEIPNIEVLNMQQFHLSNAMADKSKFEQELVAKLTAMSKVLKKAIIPMIKQSRKEPLRKSEMKAILEAYSDRVALPKYIVRQILDHVEEETVWGFSQAVSWVRTHGQFDEKKAKLPKEERRLVQNLENIAGEVFSITPTIHKLHKVLGKKPITKKVLTTPQKIKNKKLKAMVHR